MYSTIHPLADSVAFPKADSHQSHCGRATAPLSPEVGLPHAVRGMRLSMRITPWSLGVVARRLALPFCAVSVMSCGGGSDAPPATTPVVPSPPPAEGTFSTAAAMVMPRAWHTATLLPNGKVLLIGGSPSWPPTAAVATSAELYDLATNTFSATGSLAFARRGGHALLIALGRPNGH